ncbi:MAG: hypothetical protein ABIG96_02670 [Candidatus Micrarchaeota archaeon]
MPEEKKEYTEKELDGLFEKAGKYGAILALIHFDSYGRDKEVVKASLVDLISRINAEKGVAYCRGEIEEVLETEDEKGKAYSTYTEVKVLCSNFDIAIGLALRYGPVAIEVLYPKELKLNTEQMQNTLLSASSISQQFTNYFMSKLLKPDEFADYQENLKKRVEHGKQLMDGAEKKDEKPANSA